MTQTVNESVTENVKQTIAETLADTIGGSLTITLDHNIMVGGTLALLTGDFLPPPTRIALELPTHTRKDGTPMPNFELLNDQIVTITIKTTNSAGATEPAPAGDVFSVVSSNPTSLGAAMGTDAAGNPAVVLTPLVQASPGLSITVSDSAGLAQDVQIVDIVQDLTPTNVVLDLAAATHVSQPVPTNPGP